MIRVNSPKLQFLLERLLEEVIESNTTYREELKMTLAKSFLKALQHGEVKFTVQVTPTLLKKILEPIG